MRKLLFLFSVCLILLGCSSDDNGSSKQINYIEVINNSATIHYNNYEKKVTSDYTIGSKYFSVTNWRKETFHINRNQLKEIEKRDDSNIYWYNFYKGSSLLIIKF